MAKKQTLGSPAKKCFQFIVDYKTLNNGNSPSIREIRRACDISSTSVTHFYLRKLQEHGVIELPDWGMSRSLRVVGSEWKMDTPGELVTNVGVES